MKIKFNVTKDKRKQFAQEIARWLGEDVKYLGAPTFAYEVARFSIDKDSNLICSDFVDDSVVERLLEHLYEEGFESDISAESNEEESFTGLSISMPMQDFTETSIQNLRNLVEAKSNLIKKAVGADALPIEIIDNRICFDWFKKECTPEEIQAYMQFVTALCHMAKTQKRINAKEKEYENEKYAFRCFLLRLEFIGDDYKAARKILMRNFTGSSAFKTVKESEEVA